MDNVWPLLCLALFLISIICVTTAVDKVNDFKFDFEEERRIRKVTEHDLRELKTRYSDMVQFYEKKGRRQCRIESSK